MPSDEELIAAICETDAWLSHLIAAGKTMWSPELEPPSNPSLCRDKMIKFPLFDLEREQRRIAVNELIDLRRSSLPSSRVLPTGLSSEQRSRLFAYYPERSLNDGMAQSESDGLLDATNCPAWDNWVAYVEATDPFNDVLVFMAAPSQVRLVLAGAYVIPEQCVTFLGDELSKPEYERRSISEAILKAIQVVPDGYTSDFDSHCRWEMIDGVLRRVV